MDSDRFEKQLRFILEIDKLKTVYRRTYLLNADRPETTAEINLGGSRGPHDILREFTATAIRLLRK